MKWLKPLIRDDSAFVTFLKERRKLIANYYIAIDYKPLAMNYKIAFNQYSQAILSFDKLLIAFNDMLASRFNYSSSLANLLYTKTKIDINNKTK